MKAGPIVSDNGNFVIDAPFPEEQMKDPVKVYAPFNSSLILANGSSQLASGSDQTAHWSCRSRAVLSDGQGGILR